MPSDLVGRLAQEIRRMDGDHTLGAAALAEALAPFVESALRAGAEPVGYADGWRLHELREGRVNLALWAEKSAFADTPLYTRPQPATPASGDGIAGRVNGYLPRQRAVEVVMDAPLPAWITGNPNVRVTIVPTPPASKGGE